MATNKIYDSNESGWDYGIGSETDSIDDIAIGDIILDDSGAIDTYAANTVTTIGSLSAQGGLITNGSYYIGNPGNWSTGITADDKSGLSVTGKVTAEDYQFNNGTSLGSRLEAIEARLAILVPDPAKLEKYEALKHAYEQYKLLEKLCNE